MEISSCFPISFFISSSAGEAVSSLTNANHVSVEPPPGVTVNSALEEVSAVSSTLYVVSMWTVLNSHDAGLPYTVPSEVRPNTTYIYLVAGASPSSILILFEPLWMTLLMPSSSLESSLTFLFIAASGDVFTSSYANAYHVFLSVPLLVMRKVAPLSVGSDTSILNSIPSSERSGVFSLMFSRQPETEKVAITAKAAVIDFEKFIGRVILQSVAKVIYLMLRTNILRENLRRLIENYQ